MSKVDEQAAAEALSFMQQSPSREEHLDSPFRTTISRIDPETSENCSNSLSGTPDRNFQVLDSPWQAIWKSTPLGQTPISSDLHSTPWKKSIFSPEIKQEPSAFQVAKTSALGPPASRRKITICQNQILPTQTKRLFSGVIRPGKATGDSSSDYDVTTDLLKSAEASESKGVTVRTSSPQSLTRNLLAASPDSNTSAPTPSSFREQGAVHSPLSSNSNTSETNATNPSSVEDPENGDKRTPCNCKKSKCLKLYCECFAAKAYCSGCKCVECSNTIEAEPARQMAIKATLDRNPLAFQPKTSAGDSQGHLKGCQCRKSNCLKKYCECFLGEVHCGTNCKCLLCKNYEGSAELKRRRNGPARSHSNRSVSSAGSGGSGSTGMTPRTMSTNSAAAALFQLGSSNMSSSTTSKKKRPAVSVIDSERASVVPLAKKKCIRLGSTENSGPFNLKKTARTGSRESSIKPQHPQVNA